MKKSATMLMIFLQIILLAACAATDAKDASKQDTNIGDDGETPTNEPMEEDDGIIYMTVQEFYSYFTDVDITPDNWQDYFEITEEEWTKTDAFGEVISTEINYIVAAKENLFVIWKNNEVVMRFSITGSGNSFDEQGIAERDVEIGDDGTGFLLSKQRDTEELNEIADYTVIKTLGYVTVSTLPDDMWNENEDGEKYIAVKVSDDKIYCLYANGDRIVKYADGSEDHSAGRGERDGMDINALDGWNWNDFFNLLEGNGYGRAEHTSSD